MDGSTNEPEASSDFWNRYEGDIQLAKNIGVKAFRFSFEWHRIEPEPGVIDKAAIKRYHQILDAIAAAGMVPSATLHHFVHPLWWDKRGAFEKEENIDAFVNFCKICAEHFGSRVTLWATFNEPTCLLVCGYLLGVHPPGRVANFWLMGKVILNILKSHTRAYHAMKAVPGAENTEIGLVHHHVEFMPSNPSYWWIKPLTWWGTFWWGRDVVLEYLVSGKFEWHVPLCGTTIKYQEPSRPPLDWWGINYYARGVVSGACMPGVLPGEIMTDMGYTLYPNGLYENIVRGAQLGVPMYISETGAADRSEGEAARKAHIESYLGQCLKAVRDGYDVRGFFYWTLVDNFEWNTGHTMKFGLYEWKADGSVDRRLREGGRLLARIYASLPSDMTELRKHLKKNYRACDYEVLLAHEQIFNKPLPMVLNKGRYVCVPPLSPLHLRIGFHDIEEDVSLVDQQEAEQAAGAFIPQPAFAA